MTYTPTPGPHEGEQYIPSGGLEGVDFICEWCGNCAKDREMNGTCHDEGREPGDDDWCEILNASYRGEAVEWRELENGDVKCIAFVKAGERVPDRCPHTQDLFG